MANENYPRELKQPRVRYWKDRITVKANGRNDHVTMFTVYLPLAVFTFSVKLSSFGLASKARIILYYSHLCTKILQENMNANLTFAVCRKPA